MKKIVLLILPLFVALPTLAQPAQWLKKIDYFATEYVGRMAYVPDSANVEASLWTFTYGELPAQMCIRDRPTTMRRIQRKSFIITIKERVLKGE